MMTKKMTIEMDSSYNDIFGRFRKLSPIAEGRETYDVVTISRSYPHKIGMTSEGYPILFIECADSKSASDISLKLFKVLFNQVCQLNEEGTVSDKDYTIVQLNSSNMDFQKYFLEVMCLIFERIPVKPTVDQLRKEVGKIISMFTGNASVSKEVVKGLWAELFLIERAKNTDYLVSSWHVSPEDKYDFNDGIDKIEVKCTGNVERVHHFAIEQLNPNSDSQLLIASCIIIATGIGTSVFDLVDKISARLTDVDLRLKLKSIVMQTIGNHFEEVKKMKFDYVSAKDNLRLYDYKQIPAIKLSDVPVGVTEVHFAVCLKNLEESKYKSLNSNLFNAL